MPFSKLTNQIAAYFKRKREKKPKAEGAFEELFRHTVESLSENASLTADLDDDAAKLLLEWTVSGVKTAFQNPVSFVDRSIEVQIQAARQLMREVNKWIPSRTASDINSNLASLEKISQKITVIYGPDYKPPSHEALMKFLDTRLSLPTVDFLSHLFQLFDPQQTQTEAQEFNG